MRGRPGLAHLKLAYRSGLEAAVAAALASANVAYTYETVKLPFTQPAKSRTYKPDFIMENGVVVETKGLLSADDRAKHLWVKETHPDIEVRFCFSNPKARLSKASPTTYGDWATKHGFKFSRKEIPPEWTTEPPNAASVAALRRLGWKL